MENKYLYETIEVLEEMGMLNELPTIINEGLSDNIVLRDYQISALKYFVTYFENENIHKKQAKTYSFSYGNRKWKNCYYGRINALSIYKRI